MASIDPASFLQELTKYTKSVQSDSSLYDKSKCEKFLSDIDDVLTSDPAHAQKRSFEHHRATLVGFLSSRVKTYSFMLLCADNFTGTYPVF